MSELSCTTKEMPLRNFNKTHSIEHIIAHIRSKIHKKSRICNLNLRGLHRDHSEWSIRQREQDLTPPALNLKEVR